MLFLTRYLWYNMNYVNKVSRPQNIDVFKWRLFLMKRRSNQKGSINQSIVNLLIFWQFPSFCVKWKMKYCILFFTQYKSKFRQNIPRWSFLA